MARVCWDFVGLAGWGRHRAVPATLSHECHVGPPIERGTRCGAFCRLPFAKAGFACDGF